MIQLPPVGTQEQKQAVFKFLAQSRYSGKVERIICGPVSTKNGGIAGRFQDGETVVYCCLTPDSPGTWQAQYQVVSFAENEPDTAESFTEQLRNEAGQLTDGWISQIKDLLDTSDTLADFRESISSLYSKLSINDMSAVMGEAMTAARLAGQFEAENGD